MTFHISSFPRTTGALLIALTVGLTLGCSRKEEAGLSAPAPAAASDVGHAGFKGGLAKAGGDAQRARRMDLAQSEAKPAAPAASPAQDVAPDQRFLAVRHDLSAEVASDQLPAAWGIVRDLCGTLRCELLSSALQRETPQQPGHA